MRQHWRDTLFIPNKISRGRGEIVTTSSRSGTVAYCMFHINIHLNIRKLIKTHRQTDRHRQTHTHPMTHTYIRDTDTNTDTDKDRWTDRQTDRYTDRQIDVSHYRINVDLHLPPELCEARVSPFFLLFSGWLSRGRCFRFSFDIHSLMNSQWSMKLSTSWGGIPSMTRLVSFAPVVFSKQE